MQELTPPENATTPSISLTAPEPVKEIQKSEADQMVKLDESQIPELDAKVDAFVDHVITNSVHSDEFRQNVQSIHNLGTKEIRESAQVSNRMLDLPAKSLNDSLFFSTAGSFNHFGNSSYIKVTLVTKLRAVACVVANAKTFLSL